MREFVSVTTAMVLAAVCAFNILLTGEAPAFLTGGARQPQFPPARSAGAGLGAEQRTGPAGFQEALGVKGVFGFGMGFGLLVAATRGAQLRRCSSKVGRKAESAEVAVKEAGGELAESELPEYLANVPNSLLYPRTLARLLYVTPKEQWDEPPPGTPLHSIKAYLEVYGPGKYTKMGFFDYLAYKTELNATEIGATSVGAVQDYKEGFDIFSKGKIPFQIPGPGGAFGNGAITNWRPDYAGREPFSSDIITPLTDGRFGRLFIKNQALFREGLKPWQRGLEIGMAHGYFLIGPFIVFGPLRNTPEAATVGLLCGIAIVGIVSAGGLLFGACIKPQLLDKDGDKPGAGFTEMINWHAIGGLGGAGFAHALISVFGSG